MNPDDYTKEQILEAFRAIATTCSAATGLTAERIMLHYLQGHTGPHYDCPDMPPPPPAPPISSPYDV